ncbi:MAG: hypothetical protein ACI8WT_003557 [Clostridium sp.]|jgi:hypothetical protein
MKCSEFNNNAFIFDQIGFLPLEQNVHFTEHIKRTKITIKKLLIYLSIFKK